MHRKPTFTPAMGNEACYRITITRVITGKTVLDRKYVNRERAIARWEKEAGRCLDTASKGGSIEMHFLMRHQDGQWKEPAWNMETMITAP